MFYSVNEDWISNIKKDYSVIRNELLSFLKTNSQDLSAQYPEYTTSGNWQTIPLVFFTIKHPEFFNAFPKTINILENVPELIGAEFSILKSDTVISPHIGYSKQIMRTHVGLVVPSGDLGLKCGNDIETWQEGESLSFNDGIVHEAWNKSLSERLILMIDSPIPNSSYTAKEISFYKMNNLEDEALLKIASKEQWVKWVNFPK